MAQKRKPPSLAWRKPLTEQYDLFTKRLDEFRRNHPDGRPQSSSPSTSSTSTPKSRDTIAHFLKELAHPAKRLTEWELNFLEDITDQFERRGTLTDRQFEKLEEIYCEKSEG